jgi:flagellar hook-associated protein 3 FlgL
MEQIRTAQRVASSGKKISRPSDDPSTMADIMDARQILSTIEQYQRNIDKAELHFKALSTTFAAVDDFMQRASNIAAGAGQDAQLNTTLANDLDLIRSQVLQLANQRLGDEYLFAGHRVNAAPFLEDGSYTGDQGAFRVRVSQTTEITLQVDGRTVFVDTEDIFSLLDNLQIAIENGDKDQINILAAALDRFKEHLQTVQAEIGGARDYLELSRKHLNRFSLTIEKNLADTELADPVAAIMELQTHNTVYEAALSAAAKLLQPSLLDFLR